MNVTNDAIGDLYMVGAMVPKDTKKAVEYYRNFISGNGVSTMSANEGNSRGKYLLAQCLFNGTGIEEDKKKAVQLWIELANEGNTTVMYSLALCYRYGHHGLSSIEKAQELEKILEEKETANNTRFWDRRRSN